MLIEAIVLLCVSLFSIQHVSIQEFLKAEYIVH